VAVGVGDPPHWKLRSSFRFPLPSRFSARAWIGAPLIEQAPLPAPQYVFDARCAPQTSTTSQPWWPRDCEQALPGLFTVKVTSTSPVFVPDDSQGSGEWVGTPIEEIVPP
jgi:hypothetical protein